MQQLGDLRQVGCGDRFPFPQIAVIDAEQVERMRLQVIRDM